MSASEEELGYHQRILDSDEAARGELCNRYLGELVRRLQRYYPKADADLVTEAAVDALLNYLKAPAKYAPKLKSLFGYLLMSATGDLKNKLNAQRRRDGRQTPLDDVVGFGRWGGNSRVEGDESLNKIAAQELKDAALALGKDETEHKLIALLLDEVREYQPYAAILGLAHLPIAEQQREVNKAKERLRIRFKRHLGKEWSER